MVVFIKILNLAAIEPLLLGIPEPGGLLLFGLALTTTAVTIRWYLRRGDSVKSEDRQGKEI